MAVKNAQRKAADRPTPLRRSRACALLLVGGSQTAHQEAHPRARCGS